MWCTLACKNQGLSLAHHLLATPGKHNSIQSQLNSLDIQALGLESENFGFHAKSINYKTNLGKFLNLSDPNFIIYETELFYLLSTDLFFFFSFLAIQLGLQDLSSLSKDWIQRWTVKVPSPIH